MRWQPCRHKYTPSGLALVTMDQYVRQVSLRIQRGFSGSSPELAQKFWPDGVQSHMTEVVDVDAISTYDSSGSTDAKGGGLVATGPGSAQKKSKSKKGEKREGELFLL